MLQRAGIVALIGEFEPAGMAQHVGVERRSQLQGREQPDLVAVGHEGVG
jgi:hypothetical protein